MKRIALYELSKMPTTFDFATWSVIAKTHGANHVRFVYEGNIATWKYPETIAWRRFANILIPITRLSGMSYSMGKVVDGETYPYSMGDTIRMFKKLGRIEKLKSIVPFPPGPYTTLTLRGSFRGRYRNSNMAAWMMFKEYLESIGKKVIIFPECEDDPIDIVQRMAVYAGAEMNLGASCGPMALCQLSDAPYIVLNICPKNETDEKTYDMETLLRKTGYWKVQLPYRNSRQIIVWEPDDYETILKSYEEMTQERMAA